ncbi:MAG TPA: hypothetical protein VGW34_09405, partial [Allosphingosinicella sp.]|nr:hypothetical protein [Allosphingosinicella sp.]
NQESNSLTGNEAGNVLRGGAGRDVIDGAGGDDSLFGSLGFDTLIGGAGGDGFHFDHVRFGVGFNDVISDLTPADDTVFLDRTAYTELDPGTLDPDAFVIGTGAEDSEDRIIYDPTNGNLIYDPDGTGPHNPALFAIAATGLDLSHLDFAGYN